MKVTFLYIKKTIKRTTLNYQKVKKIKRFFFLFQCAASSDSLSESDCSRNTGNSSLVDALSLSTSRQGSLLTDTLPYMSSDSPQVPHIVTVCFKHLETYGKFASHFR